MVRILGRDVLRIRFELLAIRYWLGCVSRVSVKAVCDQNEAGAQE